jgi:hypothetical protein
MTHTQLKARPIIFFIPSRPIDVFGDLWHYINNDAVKPD